MAKEAYWAARRLQAGIPWLRSNAPITRSVLADLSEGAANDLRIVVDSHILAVELQIENERLAAENQQLQLFISRREHGESGITALLEAQAGNRHLAYEAHEAKKALQDIVELCGAEGSIQDIMEAIEETANAALSKARESPGMDKEDNDK